MKRTAERIIATLMLLAMIMVVFNGSSFAAASPTPSIGTITYTTAPLTTGETETVKVTLNESSQTQYDRTYYMQVLAVRSSGTYQIAQANITMNAGNSSQNYYFNVSFNTAGEVYTKVRVYDYQGGTLLAERQGTYPDTVENSGTSLSNFPYYDQYDNYTYGGKTCNLTSIAMALDYYEITDPNNLPYGWSRTPDYLIEYWGGPVYDAAGMDNVFNDEAEYRGSPIRMSTVYGYASDLRAELEAGRPVMVQGWFTNSGHVMMVTGYDGENYICQDPAGEWNLTKYGGYGYPGTYNSVSTKYGKSVKYPKAEFEYAATGDDGYILYHNFR